MSTKDLSQQGEATFESSHHDEVTPQQLMVSAAKKVLIMFACVIGCIVVFGAVDLYGEMVWGQIKGVVTYNGTSVWPACLLGLLSSAVGAWSIILLTQSVQSKALIFLLVLSVCFWLIGFSAANALLFDEDFPELEGFVWWAYLALWIPVLAALLTIGELN